MSYEKITVIANPISGGQRNRQDRLDYVFDYFSRNGYQCTLKETSRRGEARNFALQAVEEKDDLVIVIGGDGTINEITTALVGSEVAMGLIPAGSGNGLARTLGIPFNLERACHLIATGEEVKIDAGKANNRIFALVAGVGFDAKVGKRFDEHHKRGAAGYFYLGAKEFLFYTPDPIKISFDDKSFEISPFVVAVANGKQYGNNAIIAPDAILNDGLLDITIVHQTSNFQLLRALPKLFGGKLARYPHAEFYQTKFVRIERNTPGLLNIDGEPVLEEPVIEVSILPQSLKIISPPNTISLT
ncbi:MAG: diacylglycerol/lipid kinase family protein [bacterium]